MKKLLVLMLISYLTVVSTSCAHKPSSTSISGTVNVTRSNIESPFGNAIISINGSQTYTGEDGTYGIGSLEKGMSTVEVFIDFKDINPDIYSQKYRINTNPEESNSSKVRIWSRKVNLRAGNNLLNIFVEPLAVILRLVEDGSEKWQLTFYTSPPDGKEITGGVITDPNGKKHGMEPHFGTQWHVWMPITDVLEGFFEYEIIFDDGSQERFGVYLSEKDYNIDLPLLIFPTNYTAIDSSSITFQYQFSQDATKAYLRIEELDGGKWLSRDWISINNDEHTVDSAFLKKGKSYRWTVQPVYKAKVIPWTEAKADYEYFSIK